MTSNEQTPDERIKQVNPKLIPLFEKAKKKGWVQGKHGMRVALASKLYLCRIGDLMKWVSDTACVTPDEWFYSTYVRSKITCGILYL